MDQEFGIYTRVIVNLLLKLPVAFRSHTKDTIIMRYLCHRWVVNLLLKLPVVFRSHNSAHRGNIRMGCVLPSELLHMGCCATPSPISTPRYCNNQPSEGTEYPTRDTNTSELHVEHKNKIYIHTRIHSSPKTSAWWMSLTWLLTSALPSGE